MTPVNHVAYYAHNGRHDQYPNSNGNGQLHPDSPPALKGTTDERHHAAKINDSNPQEYCRRSDNLRCRRRVISRSQSPGLLEQRKVEYVCCSDQH